MRLKFVALVGIAFCFPALALAQGVGGGHGKDQFIGTYDASGDRTVTREEFDARRHADFDRIDADRAGDLTEEEYVAEYAARLDKELAEARALQIRQAHSRFKVLDTDKNAKMTRKEFDESGAFVFRELDTNNDSVVDVKDAAEHF